MDTICAWCNERISKGDSDIGTVSHGICEKCYSSILSNSPLSLNAFLNRQQVPILVVNETGRAIYANEKAQRLIGKDNPEIKNKLGGEIFECIHSKKVGGCGGTKHCKACTIRNSIEHTLSTGESLFDIPATLKIKPELETLNTISFITTIRKENADGEYFVYLSIRDFVKTVE